MNKVLIIDDNPSICESIALLLDLHDIQSEMAFTPQAGLDALIEDDSYGLVIQDMNFTADTTSGREGEALFNAIREVYPDLPIILITTWTQVETAVSLIQAGAADYLAKPWDNDKLVLTVKNLLELQELQQQRLEDAHQLQLNKSQLCLGANLCGVVYESQMMHAQLDIAVRVASSRLSIIITGENGVGKEKVAEIIQANSSVAAGAFVKINVGALPKDRIEAELFGVEAGVFAGIEKRRIGRFESADHGTLFLDEVGQLSMEGQLKLLRVLETGEFQRVGSNETVSCDVRVISTTNVDLNAAIQSGAFREDLYYRLCGIEIKIPRLIDRRDDILPLLNYFLGGDYSVTPSTAKRLQSHSWPGNVRELENAAKRAMLLGQKGNLDIDLFGLPDMSLDKPTPRIVVEPSKEMIESALSSCGGVIAQAARKLGLTRQALYRRMDRYGLHQSSGRSD